MAVPATSHEVARDFAPYVQELLELLAMYGVPHGHAADLRGFNERVEAPGGFVEDVASILRSVILREGGSVPHTDLLGILVLAVAGPDVDPTSGEMPAEFRKVLSFVGSITRRPWNAPPGEASKAPVAVARPVLVPDGRGPDVDKTAGAVVGSVTARTAGTGPDSGALTASRPEAAAGADRGPMRYSRRAEGEEEHEATAAPIPAVHAAKTSASSAPLWIGALCAIGLVFGVMFYSHTSLAGAAAERAPVESITLPDPVRAMPEAKPAPEVKAEPAGTPEVAEAKKPEVKATTAPRAQSPVASVPVAKPSAAAAAAASAAAEPTPDAMLAAAAAAARTGTAEEETGGVHALLRSPVGRAGKGPYFLVSSGIMASHLVQAPAPSYPVLARMTHIQGKVVVQAVISTDGQVIATRVLDGHRLLRGAALSAVKHWRYRPYLMDGHPVNVATIITVDFHVHS